MKKRDLIEALKPLADDTEIVIDNAVTGTQFEYIDDRFRGPLISVNQIRLYEHRVYRPGEFNPKLCPPKILGVDPLRAAEER